MQASDTEKEIVVFRVKSASVRWFKAFDPPWRRQPISCTSTVEDHFLFSGTCFHDSVSMFVFSYQDVLVTHLHLRYFDFVACCHCCCERDSHNVFSSFVFAEISTSISIAVMSSFASAVNCSSQGFLELLSTFGIFPIVVRLAGARHIWLFRRRCKHQDTNP